MSRFRARTCSWEAAEVAHANVRLCDGFSCIKYRIVRCARLGDGRESGVLREPGLTSQLAISRRIRSSTTIQLVIINSQSALARKSAKKTSEVGRPPLKIKLSPHFSLLGRILLPSRSFQNPQITTTSSLLLAHDCHSPLCSDPTIALSPLNLDESVDPEKL